MTEERSPRMSSVLGETAVVIGNVSGNGDFEVRGRVQGSIHLGGRVLVAESGIVLGGIDALSITISGEVRGDLTAEDVVEIQASGKVEGNIEAPRVGIEIGAQVRGVLRTGGELSKSIQKPSFPENKNPSSAAAESSFPAEKDKRSPRRRRGGKKTEHASLPSAEGWSTSPADKTSKSSAEEGLPRPDARPRPATEGSSHPPTPIQGARAKGPVSSSAPPSAKEPESARPASTPKRPHKVRRHQGGPPAVPTFVKGAKGHQRG